MGAAAFGHAGVALGDMDLHFAWQAWHLATWILTLRGRRGTYGTELALVARPVDAVRAAAFGVAGVALGDMDLHFAWQAWHLATWISLCVAGVALMALSWLWWRAWVSVDAVRAAAFGVAGVALGDMDLHFAWQAWHLATWISLCVAGVALMALGWLWHWAGSGGALGSQLTPRAPRLLVARIPCAVYTVYSQGS